MSSGNLPSAVGHQIESTKRNPSKVRFFESRAKTPLEWVEYHAKQTPGPGAYLLKTERPSTGKFSTAFPKNYIEQAEHRGKREPGPFDYPQPGMGSKLNDPGGAFSTSYPKNYIELEEYRAAQVPGPKYKIPQTPTSGLFGKISEANPKSQVDWLVYAARRKPGPGQYPVSGGRTRFGGGPAGGGRFGTSNPKNFIELEQLRCSDHPAPDSYRINKLHVNAIHVDVKEPKRSFCSRDRLFSQLQALDQMSRKKVMTSADKKRRKEKKQQKKLANMRKRRQAQKEQKKIEEEFPGRTKDDVASSNRIALYSTKKLLEYKLSKLDDVYRRYA